MLLRISDLRYKNVVNLSDGCCLGVITDAQFDSCTGNILAMIVMGRRHFFGLFGKEDELFIPWQCIQIIGEDTVLVRWDDAGCRRKNRRKEPSL